MKKPVFLLSLTAAVILVLNFQNCGGGMVPLDGVVEQQSILDLEAEAIPRLLNDKSYIYRKTNETVSLNQSPALSETASVVLIFDRSAQGVLYRFFATDGMDEARVSVEINGMIRVWHISNSTHHAVADVPLPPADQGSLVTVAASFGQGPGAMTLLVNGIKQTLPLRNIGSPYEFSYVQRSVLLDPGVIDGAAFSKALSGLDLNLLSRSMANALQIHNVAFDPSLLNETGDQPGTPQETPQFLAAKAIIDKNCLACHNSSNYGDFRNLTQAQYIAKGLVVPKNSGASKIYSRLSGALEGAGPKNMPQGGPPLSASDVAAIAAWIQSLQ